MHLVLEIKQAQLQLDDPLFLIVRSQLADVVCQLCSTVAFKLASEISDLSFKFQIGLVLPHQFVVAVVVRAGCARIRLALTLSLRSLCLRDRFLHGPHHGLCHRLRYGLRYRLCYRLRHGLRSRSGPILSFGPALFFGRRPSLA